MNKILLAIFVFIFMFSTYAENYNKFYYSIEPIVIESADIIEFFSFYCPHCYKFDNIYNKFIKKKLPKNIKTVEYHVSFLGGVMGPVLTQAWSIATVLDIKEQIKTIIFDHIQKFNNIHSIYDLKKIFHKYAGISNKKYDDACNSFLVKSFIIQQEKTFKVNSVPTILVKGKYVINISAIDHSSINNFVKQYVKIVTFLLKK